jgi:transcription elongation factor Elf1
MVVHVVNMPNETTVGPKPHNGQSGSFYKKRGDRTEYEFRCPGCGNTKRSSTYRVLAAQQRTAPCPNCNRMRALSEVSE